MDSGRGDCRATNLTVVTLDSVIVLEVIPMRCKPYKPTLRERPLLTPSQASGLMAVFKILANDTRLRLLHALAKSGELCVTDLAAAVDMKPQAVSNQLQKLVDRSILGCRRDGLRIRYRIVDQCVTALLDQGLCLTECANERQNVHASASA
jgi:ArsR family transcriptional regulator, lead/cadmium/zinc/bismuth-responsive transcriptional repressor